jgi:hypothetical protein
VKHKLKCVKHKLKQWQSAYSKSCNPQCGPAQGYGPVGGRRLKSWLFNRYVIVVILEVFGHNHTDLQPVTPALAHDRSVNYRTAPDSKRRGFSSRKIREKGATDSRKKRLGYAFTSGCRQPPQLTTPRPGDRTRRGCCWHRINCVYGAASAAPSPEVQPRSKWKPAAADNAENGGLG